MSILFFPNFKKKKKYEDESKTSKKLLICVIYIIFLIGCIITGYYSKYQRELNGNDKAVVASWDNNIELTSSDTLHFQNGNNDINVINFNLIYKSEVSSIYSISIDNILNELGIELSNSENTLSIKKINNNYVVSFNDMVETFDINSLKNNGLVVSNNIEGVYQNNGTDTYIFKDKISNRIIKIIVNDNKYNLSFINFGEFQINDLSSKAFTLKISAVEAELPILSDLELYATFEQID